MMAYTRFPNKITVDGVEYPPGVTVNHADVKLANRLSPHSKTPAILGAFLAGLIAQVRAGNYTISEPPHAV
jgi:hypothetical protein